MDALFRLTAIEDIRVLKARYCRYVDTKDWLAFRTLFADDASLFFPENYSEQASVDDVMTGVDAALAGSITVYHVFAPEIEIISESSARGLWAMQDALYFPPGAQGFANASEIHGAGHYHETYVRRDSAWLFQSVRLTEPLASRRTRQDPRCRIGCPTGFPADQNRGGTSARKSRLYGWHSQPDRRASGTGLRL